MPRRTQLRLIEHFVAATTARIAEESSGEVDESYFGGRRKRERGAAGKVVVFGILKRGGKVYTAVPSSAPH